MSDAEVVVEPGWYSHPNLGLLKVYESKDYLKYCPIRKQGPGHYVAMRPEVLFEEIAVELTALDVEGTDVQDKAHMPAALKAMYHAIISNTQKQVASENSH